MIERYSKTSRTIRLLRSLHYGDDQNICAQTPLHTIADVGAGCREGLKRAHTRSANFSLRALAAGIMPQKRKKICCRAAGKLVVHAGRSKSEITNFHSAGFPLFATGPKKSRRRSSPHTSPGRLWPCILGKKPIARLPERDRFVRGVGYDGFFIGWQNEHINGRPYGTNTKRVAVIAAWIQINTQMHKPVTNQPANLR